MSDYRHESRHRDASSQVVGRILWYAMRTWATAVEVFVRKDLGYHYLGPHAASVLLLIPVYIAVCEKFDPRPMLIYLVAYLVCCAGQRLNMLRRYWRGERGHRYYNGRPRLWWLCPRASERTLKQVVEPLVICGTGAGLMPVLPSVGLFLIVGGVCSALIQIEWNVRMQNRANEMYDAVLEQQETAERFRDLSQD